MVLLRSFSQLEKPRTYTPEERPILRRHHIQMLRRLAEAATPGPYHLVTDSCDCQPDYGCSHGSWPYKMETRGVIEDSMFGKRSGELFSFDDSVATMEDAQFLEQLNPQTIIALCLLAEDSLSERWSEHVMQEVRRTLDSGLDLSLIPTYELSKELHKRAARGQSYPYY